MHRLLPLLVVCCGCVDYDQLQKPFCATAMSGSTNTQVALCDDFEADGKSPTWTRVVNGGATAQADDPQHFDHMLAPFRGSQSLHLIVPAAGQAALEDNAATRSLSAGDLYIRVFLHLVDASSAGSLEIYSVRDAAGMPIVSLVIENDQYHVVAGGRDVAFGNALAAGTVRGSEVWICTELAILRNAQSTPPVPHVDLYVDPSKMTDPPVAQLAGVPLGDYAATRVGADRTTLTTGGATELWMDEVIMDSARIGCLK